MDVSILISVHNRVELTRACVDSIFETMPTAWEWELLIYDDQSTDATAAFLATLAERRQRVRLMRETTRGWFARNNNQLARNARGQWLLFLNNDTICLPGWFEPLYEVATGTVAGNSRVAVVGGLQVFPGEAGAGGVGGGGGGGGGVINHAGVVIDRRGLPCHLYEGLSADLPAAAQTREMQAVTAACWLTEAKVFHELGGFYEGFRNGYEDIDYCLRVRQDGAQIWYCGASRIIHYGGCTSARFDHESANQALFLERSRQLAQEDLAATVKGDGLRWPVHTIWYRGVRALWTGRLVQPVVRRLLRFPWVIQLRDQAIRWLTPAPPTSKD